MNDRQWIFRYRGVVIAAVFWAGFLAYFVDHRSVIDRVAEWLHVSRAARPKVMHAALGVGAALCLTAALIRTWATAYLESEVVYDTAVHSERLVADGPYRYVRNPLYFASLLFAAGIALMASAVGFVIIIVGMFLIVDRLIACEELAFTASQGREYRKYVDAVPRLVPALRPRMPPAHHPLHVAAALFGESPFWVWAAAATLYAVTLNGRVNYLLMAAGLALYFVQGIRGRRSA